MDPLVTCLCLTRNRREWLPKAVECFGRQTYANRQLLIVPDSEDDYAGIDFRFEVSILWCFPGHNVGKKRNIGSELAKGELIAIWDDDDFSAPGRLADQVATLRMTGKDVTGYQALKFTDGREWWQYTGAATHLPGTTLCFRKAWWENHRFNEVQVGQDEEFSAEAARAKQLAAEPDKDLMYATIHAGNTAPRQTSAVNNWSKLEGFAWKAA